MTDMQHAPKDPPEPSTTQALLPPAKMSPLVKMALEMGTLVVFFLANARAGVFIGTALFMLATCASLITMWMLARRLPVMPLVSGVVVLVFGGLTLVLQNDVFIKLKPTIINLLFGSLLLGGLAFGRLFLPIVFDGVLRLTTQGWRLLTWRWALFFFVLAGVNELVWRSTSTDTWVAFKVWGMMPLTFVFMLTQLPLLEKHTLPDDDENNSN